MFSKRGTAKTLRIAGRHSGSPLLGLRPFGPSTGSGTEGTAGGSRGPNPGRSVSLSNRRTYTFSEPKIRTTSLTR